MNEQYIAIPARRTVRERTVAAMPLTLPAAISQ
jgi:hypothetical protein